MSWEDVDVHTMMLADRVRTEAFQHAIEAVVKPGMAVLDIGCGTGILSFFARRAGARRVYAIDSSPIIKAAKAVAKKNGIDGIEFIKTDGGDFDLPEKVDVIVSECLGHYVFTDAMLPMVLRARDRHLVKDGTMIPSSIALKAAFALTPPHEPRIDFYDEPRYGLDLSPLATFARGRWRKLRFADRAISDPIAMGAIDLQVDPAQPSETIGSFELHEATRVHGITAWFDAVLAPTLTLRTGPTEPPTCWEQAYFPLREAVEVMGSGTVRIRPVQTKVGAFWQWEIRWENNAVQNDDLVQLHLISTS